MSLLVIIAGCQAVPAADESDPHGRLGSASQVQPLDSLPGRDAFVEEGLRISADSRHTFASAIGEPDSVQFEVIPNRHVPGVTDTIFTLHHADLIARIHRPGGGGELVSSISVSSNRHLRYPVIGIQRAAILGAFGAPDGMSDSSMTYRCTRCEGGDNPVELMFRGDQVTRVQFNYYVD